MRKTIDVTQKASPEQIAMLAEAAKIPAKSDDEYPEFSESELAEFKKISENRKVCRQKQTVTIRLSPQAFRKAKSLGKGYTSVLSRILENTLDNPELVKNYL